MKKRPEISVIMSTYNTPEKFLRESIESILKQTFDNFEFIIIDDFSSNNNVRVINSYSDPRIIRVLNEENIGLTASLNKGIKIAKGKYIARMDADDISLPNRLLKQYQYMEANLEIAVLGTRGERFGAVSGLVGVINNNNESIKARLFFSNGGIIHPSVMIRNEFLKKYKLLYDENIKKSQDYDLWVRCLQYGSINVLPQVLFKYRVHEMQISTKQKSSQLQFVNLIRERQVRNLGIEMTEREKDIHFALCSGVIKGDIQEVINWIKRLKEANRNIGLIDPKAFERELMTLWAVAIIKYSIKNKHKILPLLPFLLKVINPVYFIGYYDYIINRKLRQKIK